MENSESFQNDDQIRINDPDDDHQIKINDPDDDHQIKINDPDDDHLIRIDDPDPSSTRSSSSSSSSSSLRRDVVEECDGVRVLPTENETLVAELAALRGQYEDLEVKVAGMEERLHFSEREKEEVVRENLEFGKRVEAVLSERDAFRIEIDAVLSERDAIRSCLEEREYEFGRKIEEFEKEVEGSRRRIVELENERSERIRVFTESLGLAQMAKEGLTRIIECVDEEKMENGGGIEKEAAMKNGGLELGEELMKFLEEVEEIAKLSNMAEAKVRECRAMWKKERKELENSVVSLTEENRDTYSLLRIALVEKEAVEKSLNKLKGNTDQKRVALLQIAERGLQRVGFGFMMGGGSTDQSLDIAVEATHALNALNRSDSNSSEVEEDVISLASTVEKIMKNLRLEITQLRRSLEESRSDTERLQSLTEKQAQTIAENTMYIKDLEERERLMAQSVEELLTELQETEEEVARWKQACEMEVEAGKSLVKERDKLVAILQQELEKTKAALQISNSKLKLKEDLAASAMAAQAAAERSLYLADSRASEFRERIEELTKQLEEPDSRDKSRRRVRHICWPWQVLKLNQAANSTNARVRNQRRRMLPEMQSLLH